VALRHVGTHDEDGVRIYEIAGKCRRPTPAERNPQTGDCGGVSDPCLIFYGYNTQAVHELLLGIVPFIGDCCTSE
jgi:hypothetical protein